MSSFFQYPVLSEATTRRRGRIRKLLAISCVLWLDISVVMAFGVPRPAIAGQSRCRARKRHPTATSAPDVTFQPFSESNGLHSTDPSKDHDTAIRDSRSLGVLVLLTVPLAWGTFEPAVRYVYAMKPALPGFLFSVGYYVVAALSLSTLANLSMLKSDGDVDEKNSELPIQGGIELGIYLFLGNALQVLGLKTVPSDRAAFLLQLTTIFVPLVQAVFARDLSAVPLRTWGACVIALTGVGVMGLDGQEGVLGTESAVSSLLTSLISLSQGDVLIMLAAFAYTFHCIRLGRYAKETSAIKLAACKATTETVLSLSLVLSLVAFSSNPTGEGGSLAMYATEEGRDISHFVASISKGISSGNVEPSMLLPALGAVVWTGLVSVAYTIYAQSFGQSRVDAVTANLIYTVQPIFTSLFAWGLLGETLGWAGYLGGTLIGAAVYLVAVSEEDSDERGEDDSESVDEDERLLAEANN